MAKSGSLPRGELLSRAWRLGCQLGIFIKETHQSGMARNMSSQELRNRVALTVRFRLSSRVKVMDSWSRPHLTPFSVVR
eukprot:scaffold29976_cov151-Isochrysis_galbana.AAC.2